MTWTEPEAGRRAVGVLCVAGHFGRFAGGGWHMGKVKGRDLARESAAFASETQRTASNSDTTVRAASLLGFDAVCGEAESACHGAAGACSGHVRHAGEVGLQEVPRQHGQVSQSGNQLRGHQGP